MRGKRDISIDRARFPVDPWRLVETSAGDDTGTTETLFAVGNGFVGVRAAPLDGSPGHSPGVIVNGFHETWPIEYPENAYGLARVGQSIVSAPDALSLSVRVDGQPLAGRIEEHHRSIDVRRGVLVRDAVWATATSGRVRVRSELVVSFTRRHVAAARLEVTPLDVPATVTIRSPLRNRQDEQLDRSPSSSPEGDPRRGRAFAHRVLELQFVRHEGPHDAADGSITVGYRCARSGMSIACSQRHVHEGVATTFVTDATNTDAASTDAASTDATNTDAMNTDLTATVATGTTLALTKFVSYHSGAATADALALDCRADVEAAAADGWQHVVGEQREWLDRYWSRTDIAIDGDDAAQQAVRWNLFQLAQATARTEVQGIAAKGVSAGGYDGHYFWDTEIYVIPFLAATNPTAARRLLEFRAAMLPAARRRAAEMAQRGALFPWRTITGEEASAYYPAGTAQYHIDAAVAHALDRYVAATGDVGFLVSHGAEMLVEIARLYADLGCYDRADPPAFHIHGVTGPDEYTAVVDDNLYTNVMARFALRFAADTVVHVERTDPDAHAALVRRTGLAVTEIDEWRLAADAMHVGYDSTLGIHPQDASFLSHEPWDFDGVPDDRYPLLLHFHPLVIYRHQVLKQADVVLAMFLRAEEFPVDVQRRDFDYYDALTTGDSSLSACVQSIVAAQVGHDAAAFDYFEQSLYLDPADTHGNTCDGVHIANAGGVWAALVHGFAGVRDGSDALHVTPRLPAGWRSIRFRLLHRGSTLDVEADHGGATVTVLVGACRIATVDGITSIASGESVRITAAGI